jgi:hypothetical protein
MTPLCYDEDMGDVYIAVSINFLCIRCRQLYYWDYKQCASQ